MDSLEQRWLSLEGICSRLGMTHTNIKYLVGKGVLVAMYPKGKNNFQDARFLDPTPEYAEKLKLGEALYGRIDPLPSDLDMKALLTVREVAKVMGWNMYYARKYMVSHKVPAVKAGKYYLYPVETIRKFLWKRQGRELAHQRSPFILDRLVKWFLEYHAADNDAIPTDEELAKDDILMRKLTRLSKLKSPKREIAMKEFLEKVEMAKKIAFLMKSSEASSSSAKEACSTIEDATASEPNE